MNKKDLLKLKKYELIKIVGNIQEIEGDEEIEKILKASEYEKRIAELEKDNLELSRMKKTLENSLKLINEYKDNQPNWHDRYVKEKARLANFQKIGPQVNELNKERIRKLERIILEFVVGKDKAAELEERFRSFVEEEHFKRLNAAKGSE